MNHYSLASNLYLRPKQQQIHTMDRADNWFILTWISFVLFNLLSYLFFVKWNITDVHIP